MMDKSLEVIMPWKKTDIPPEKCGIIPEEAYNFSLIRVLVTGKYADSDANYVDIANRILGKKLDNPQINECTVFIVPLDGEWHWKSGMDSISAWCLLPDSNDPRWIPCDRGLPEQRFTKKHIGDLQLFSVLALCDVEGAEREVRLVNRYRIDSKASNILADQDTGGWLWSTNGKNVIAWMPLPVPFKE